MASGALDKNLPSTEAINHSQALTDSKEAPIQQKSIPAEPGSQARLSNDETTPTGDIGRNSGELSPRGLANGLPTRSKSLKRPAQEMASTLDASPPLNGVAGKDAEQELSPTSRSVAQSDMNAAAGKSSQSDPSSPGKSGGNNQVSLTSGCDNLEIINITIALCSVKLCARILLRLIPVISTCIAIQAGLSLSHKAGVSL